MITLEVSKNDLYYGKTDAVTIKAAKLIHYIIIMSRLILLL